mgnify:CR=1 FL=1
MNDSAALFGVRRSNVMARRPNRSGGGAKTNENGLSFEGRADLRDAIREHPNYELDDQECVIDESGELVAEYFEKHGLYKYYLEPNGVDWEDHISSKLLPDSALLVGETMYIIEKKYQETSGSVDEKLQTCVFKKQQYEKLLDQIGVSVEYVYVFNDWFDQPRYNDVLEFIMDSGCFYYFNEIPLEDIGL